MESKEIARQIEMRLAELGIKKSVFYKLAGVSSASFSQWNTGKSQPSRDALHRIDSVLGTSFELSQNSDNMFDMIQMLQELRDSERALLQVTKNMSDEEIRRTTEFIKSLKEGTKVD